VTGARWAIVFERLWPAAWPVLAVLGLFAAISLLGIWQRLPLWLHGAGLVAFAGALVVAAGRLLPGLRWPRRDEALARIERDSGVRHQPLRALDDALPSELGDPRTRRLWEAHRQRLLGGLGQLKLAAPRSDLPRRDPWAFRAALLLLLAVALVDAGGLAGKRLVDAFRLGRSAAAATTPLAVTLWITPPAYTGRAPMGVEAPPAITAEDAPPRPPLIVPAGSVALAQLHHLPAAEPAAAPQLALNETAADFTSLGDGSAEARLELKDDGSLVVRLGDGREVASWIVDIVPDQVPKVSFVVPPKPTLRGVLRFNYLAEDDYGVVELGVLVGPSGRDDETERLVLAKPTGQQPRLASGSYLDLTAHPLAGLPVTMQLEAVDSLGQVGRSAPLELTLPERAFRHPLARAVIEQRKSLMSSPQRQQEVATRLGLLAETDLARRLGAPVELGLRSGAARLDNVEPGIEGAAGRRSVAELLWDLALYIEDGALSVAERDLRSLQEQLEKALMEGADDAELEQLMAELEQAMQRFLDELTRQAMENAQQGEQQQSQPMPLDDGRMVSRQDLQQMLDRAREMLRSGAREAAQQMLSQLREMLENLQAMAGQQQASPQQRALSDLQKMIQLQRDLLERSFRMQRQQQQGQQGQQQQGQQGQQQQGQQQQGQQQQGQPQDGMGQAAGEQEGLRRALGELMRRLGEQGMEIPRSLGQAELEMRGARDALQGQQPGQAAEDQGQALDQMQQGGQALMEQMQQQMANQPGQGPGQQPQGQQRTGRDPLGRSVRNEGGWDTNGELVPEESDLGRARGVLEELYKRSGDRARPQLELDYYNRLLDRF
jgi:uncharacterized protein (TIGR02302 family)